MFTSLASALKLNIMEEKGMITKTTSRLEITADTCVHKVRTMQQARTSDKEDVCRFVCNEHYQEQCQGYKPIGKTQVPFRRGLYAIRNFYNDHLSIASLPGEDDPRYRRDEE